MKLCTRAGLVGVLLATLFSALASGSSDDDGGCCLTLDQEIYAIGEKGVLILEGPPGSIPFLYVSRQPKPILTAPFFPRRLWPVPDDGVLILESRPLHCQSPEKFLQVAYYDPASAEQLCHTKDVFLRIDGSSCVPDDQDD